MGRFFYRPLAHEAPGPGIGAQLAAGALQGASNYMDTRQRAAEQARLEEEAARQRERDELHDSLTRAEAGWEEGATPQVDGNLFRPGGEGMRQLQSQAPRPQLQFEPGAAASVFAAKAGGFGDPRGVTTDAYSGGGGLIERYANERRPDPDQMSVTSGERTFHRLRPEVAEAREREATRAGNMQDYEAKGRFDQSLDVEDDNRAAARTDAERIRQDTEFEANIGPAAAALARASGGRINDAQAREIITASHGTGIDMGDLVPDAPAAPRAWQPGSLEEYRNAHAPYPKEGEVAGGDVAEQAKAALAQLADLRARAVSNNVTLSDGDIRGALGLFASEGDARAVLRMRAQGQTPVLDARGKVGFSPGQEPEFSPMGTPTKARGRVNPAPAAPGPAGRPPGRSAGAAPAPGPGGPGPAAPDIDGLISAILDEAEAQGVELTDDEVQAELLRRMGGG